MEKREQFMKEADIISFIKKEIMSYEEADELLKNLNPILLNSVSTPEGSTWVFIGKCGRMAAHYPKSDQDIVIILWGVELFPYYMR